MRLKRPDAKPDLLEAHYWPRRWKFLVVCILLNRTTRRQVEKILPTLWKKYPGPIPMSHANEAELSKILKPLGMNEKRANILRRFSVAYCSGSWYPEVRNLPGVGEYAEDAYQIFFKGDFKRKVRDKALDKFVRYFEHEFEICPICDRELSEFEQHYMLCQHCRWKASQFDQKHILQRRGNENLRLNQRSKDERPSRRQRRSEQ